MTAGSVPGAATTSDIDRLYDLAERDFHYYEILKDLVDECIDITLDYRQSGHPGGSRSKVHVLLSLLLSGAMRWDIRRPWLRFGDRFVLSAGHTVPLVYATLAVLNEALRARTDTTPNGDYEFPEGGRFALTWEDLPGLRHRGGLPGHAEMAGKTLFLKANTGPSGHGMPFAAGEALALKLAGAGEVKVFAVEGEGGLTPGAAHETKNSAWGLGLSNLVFLLDWNDFGIDERPASAVVHGTPIDWFEPYGWRVTGTENGMEWGPVTRTLLEATRAPSGTTPTVAWFRTRKGRGYGKYDAPSHGSPHKEHSPEFWAVRKEFMARYGVEYEGVDQAAPADAAARRAQAEANLRTAMSVMRSDRGLVEWLSDRLVEIGESVPESIEGFRLAARSAAAIAANPTEDRRLFDFENYPASMWRSPGERQPNRAGLAAWGSYVNAVSKRDYGRPLFIACSADLAEFDEHRGLRQTLRRHAGLRLVRARHQSYGRAAADRNHRVHERGHDGRPRDGQHGRQSLRRVRGLLGRLLHVRLVQLSRLRPDAPVQPARPGLRPAPRPDPVRGGSLGSGNGRGLADALRGVRPGRDPAIPGRPRPGPPSLGIQRSSRGPGCGLRHLGADRGAASHAAAHRDPGPSRSRNSQPLRGGPGRVRAPPFPRGRPQGGHRLRPRDDEHDEPDPYPSGARRARAQRESGRGDQPGPLRAPGRGDTATRRSNPRTGSTRWSSPTAPTS